MNEQHQNGHYVDLISRYLSGNAGPEEIQELEAWVLADPEHRRQFMEMKKAWMLSGLLKQEVPVEVEAQWQQMAARMGTDAKVVEMPATHKRRNWLRLAAAVLVLMMASFALYFLLRPTPEFVAQTQQQSQSFSLPDGSQVTLNRFSSLHFRQDKETGLRRAVLQGDAFFEVARDEQHAFVIQAQQVEVEVLGTSFYVDARPSAEEVQVIVATGSVAVRADTAQAIVRANEQAIFQKHSGQLRTQPNQDPNFMAIKTQTLVFTNSPLEEVVFALNRYYHTHIVLGSEALKQCTLTATYPNMSLSTILEALKTSFNLQVGQQGDQIVLTGGCDPPPAP